MKQAFRRIPLDQIDPPENVLRQYPLDEEIANLAESIATMGLINPLTVAPHDERFQVVAGHRRYLACCKLDLPDVPCILVKDADNLTMVISLTENLARKDLSPVEEAATLKELKDTQGWGTKSLAKHIGKSTRYIKDRLAVLKMQPDIQMQLHARQLGISHARLLSQIDDDVARKRYTLEAVRNGIGINTIKYWVELYAHAQQTYPQLNPDEETAQLPQETPKHLMRCTICEEPKQPYEMRTLLLCPGCLYHLMEAKHGRLPPDTLADDTHSGDGVRLPSEDREQDSET